MNISEKEYSSETNSDSNLGAIIVGYIVLSLLFIVILCCFFSICISICEEIKCLCLCYRFTRGRDIVNNEVNKNVLKYQIAETDIDTISVKIIDNICCICLDEIKKVDKISRLKCKHIFHHKCINKWYQISENASCPVCRSELNENVIMII